MEVGCLAFTSDSAEPTNVGAERLRINGHVGAMAMRGHWFGRIDEHDWIGVLVIRAVVIFVTS